MTVSPPYYITPQQYGALGNDSNDDTSAIQAAINAAAANSPQLTVYFPPGIYHVSSQISIPNSNLKIRGDSPYLSIIQTSNPNDNVFQTYGGNIEITGIAFTTSVTRTGGAYISSQTCSMLKVSNFLMSGYWYGIETGDNTGQIIDGEFDTPVIGQGIGILILGENAWAGAGVISRLLFRPLANGAQALAGIYIANCGGALISDCDIIGQGYNLYINPGENEQVSAIFVTNTYFDTATGGVMIIASGTGIARWIHFTNCWFCSHTQNGAYLYCYEGATLQQISFVNCRAHANIHGSGIATNSPYITDLQILGGYYDANIFGIYLYPGRSWFKIIGASCGPDWGNSQWGIVVSSGPSNNYIIRDNFVTGNGTGGIADEGTGGTKDVQNNF